MSAITPIIEYLLALTRPGGGKLVRFGGVQITVPVFPPGMSITWAITPYFDAFACIEYLHRFSPSIVPNAFNFNSTHRGMLLQTGLISTIVTVESHNTWIEVTEQEPITTTITNVSGVNQFFESGESFLIIDSEEDLNFVREVVRNQGALESIPGLLKETNQLLRQIAGGPPAPRPPLGGA